MRSLARQVGKLVDIIGGEAGEEQEAEAQPLLAMPQMKEATALEAGREMYQQAVKAGKAFVMGDFQGAVPHKKLVAAAVVIWQSALLLSYEKKEIHGMDTSLGIWSRKSIRAGSMC